MVRNVNFRLLGLVGLLCPGAFGAWTCGDVKTFYKNSSCCGQPAHVVDMGSFCGGGSTLDEIYERGHLICGVKDSQPGMGYWDAEEMGYTGLDISYCKAIDAALNLPEPIEWVIASASDRFEKLKNKEIDVLIRTTTWTTERDAELGADFAGMNFYDGQSILVRSDAFAAGDHSVAQLDGATICVQGGTTSEGNVEDYFAANGLTFTKVVVDSDAEADEKFLSGECDAVTSDKSAMVAKKWMFEELGKIPTGVTLWICNELLSKEPLGAATRDNDADWNEVVAWVWYGMITAEEMSITSKNYAEVVGTACEAGGDAGKCRLLTKNLGLGTADHPLPDTWMQHVLAVVGNYGEAYSKAFCDGNIPMGDCHIERTGLNALVSEGGIQFSPPLRR